jgi:lysophospholipase L1-like esterase
MFQLALGMGLTPGVDWNYPAFASFGCPAPYTNPITGARVGGTNATFCGTRMLPAPTFVSDVAIPGLRAAQAIDLTVIPTSADTLKLAQFITGSMNPVSAVLRLKPTFVTVEVGANDVLAAATRGDTTFLTSSAAFTATMNQIRDSLLTLGGSVGVAIAGVPNVTVIPHFTRASTLWCLNTGVCPGVPATPPYNSPLFTINAKCAPAGAAGVGDNYLLTLGATGAITSTLAAAKTARMDCTNDSAYVGTGNTVASDTVKAGATINTTEYTTITGRVTAFNTAIQALATAQGWAYVDVNAALATQAANIPALPNFANPTALFACPAAGCPTGTATVFSLDGVHPTKAGYRVLALAFATAITAKYPGTTITVP